MEKFSKVVVTRLEERDVIGGEISIVKVRKNNGLILTGINVAKLNGVSPTVYINWFFEDYKDGKDIDEICEIIETTYSEGDRFKDNELKDLSEFENIKDNIVFKLVNYDMNKELLEEVAHTRFGDLVLVYMMVIEVKNEELGSALIRKSLLEIWNIGIDDIEKIAKKNTERMFKPYFKSMVNTISEILEVNELEIENLPGCGMWVLGNEQKIFGASVVVYDDLLQKISDELNDDLIILPSSVHEVLILKASENIDGVGELEEMVKSININEVDREEVLSNNVYFYDRHEDLFSIIKASK